MSPKRLRDALERRELSAEGFLLLSYFQLAADDRGETVRKLRGLSDSIGWEKSEDTLLRVLRALKSGGWIEFDPRAGQRRQPYVFRLTGARVLTSAPTSAPDPPSGAEVTSAPPKSGGGGTPDVEPSRLPHHFRTAEVPGAQEEKREERRRAPAGAHEPAPAREADEPPPLEFEQAIARLGRLVPKQRTEALTAWRESEAGVRRCVEEAVAGGDRPAALFTSLIREGAHRPRGGGADGRPPLQEVLAAWIRNVGRHYHDWRTCEDEIAEHEKRRDETLSFDGRQALFELWNELHVRVEVGP